MKFQYFDANCLVKLVINKDGSEILREHLYSLGIVAVTTSFCFYEALGVLKTKWVKKSRPDNITEEQYLAACEELCAYIGDEKIQVEENIFYNRESFTASERLTKKYGIDLSDSFQLVSLQKGMMAQLKTTILPELVSEDSGLAKAAKSEGLTVLSISDL